MMFFFVIIALDKVKLDSVFSNNPMSTKSKHKTCKLYI